VRNGFENTETKMFQNPFLSFQETKDVWEKLLDSEVE